VAIGSFFMKPRKAKIRVDNKSIISLKYSDSISIQLANNKTIDFEDAYILPGLVDTHIHLIGLGIKLTQLNLDNCLSEEECVQKAIDFYSNQEWLTGRGWNQELWHNSYFPSKNTLDEVFPNIPVCLTRVDGHSLWLNSKALELAGIGRNTPNPPGGEILRDISGNPTGILIDNAMNPVLAILPKPNNQDLRNYILAADRELIRSGITEIHDMDVNPEYLQIFNELSDENRISLKINTYVSAQNNERIDSEILPYNNGKISVIGVKFYSDGALGSRGAYLLEPYSDMKNHYGLLLISFEQLYTQAKSALDNGFQIATHAIGDAANRFVLDVYAKLREDKIASSDKILRIEHAQMVHPEDLWKFRKYSIHAAVQPIHCVSDAVMAIKRLEKRVQYSYPWKSLINSGVCIAGGSDAPIESHNPFSGISAFINRVSNPKLSSMSHSECLTPESATAAYTVNAHQLIGKNTPDELSLGSPADLIIVNKDITNISAEEFSDIQVLAVITDGELVYHNKNSET